MDNEAKRNELKRILTSVNVDEALRENEELLFDFIPELRAEKGFDQRTKWHCYDVWEHTVHAVKNSRADHDIRLVLLLHDVGKPFSYQTDGNIRHFRGHAEKSAEIADTALKRLGFSIEETEEYCFYIRNHATMITEDMLKDGNIEKYKKLLYIQYCDSGAYAPEHIKQMTDKLDCVKAMILRITGGDDNAFQGT